MTPVESLDGRVEEQSKMISLPAKAMKDKSKLIEKGTPDVYQLPMTCILDDKKNGVAKYIIGKSPAAYSRPHEYVVMLVGETGAGKTTLINGMVNYILGVEWKDTFRFQLINEGVVSQSHSKTEVITVYTVYRQDGSPFHHTLTIIDTPGFGYVEGLERDTLLSGQIRNFFQKGGVKGVDTIHAICIVTHASIVRLTPTQRYIYDSILSIFGKNITSNIFLMTTFADSNRPRVLDAVREAQVSFCFDFHFNNSALFPKQHNVRSAGDFERDLDQMHWKQYFISFAKLFRQLVTMQAASLTLTSEMLDERRQLESVSQGLLGQIKFMVGNINELTQERAVMEENKAKIAANESFLYTVSTQKIIKRNIAGTGRYVTNCLTCNFTCMP